MTVGEKEEKRWRESGEGGDGKDAPWFVRMARGPAWVGRGDRVGLDWIGWRVGTSLPAFPFPLTSRCFPPSPLTWLVRAQRGKKKTRGQATRNLPFFLTTRAGTRAQERNGEREGGEREEGERRDRERGKRGERERERKRERRVCTRVLSFSLSLPLSLAPTQRSSSSLYKTFFPFCSSLYISVASSST